MGINSDFLREIIGISKDPSSTIIPIDCWVNLSWNIQNVLSHEIFVQKWQPVVLS